MNGLRKSYQTKKGFLASLICCVLIFAAAGAIRAQSVVSVNMPVICGGGSYHVSVGFSDTCNIVVGNGQNSQIHSERIFLPDGQSCGDLGCSYRSPMTFTDFNDNAIITDVNDINFVRLNMEHSFIGDIYVSITCPDNTKVDILKKGGSGVSSCNNTISASSRGWQTGSNMSVSTYLGQAYDYENNNHPCDSTATGNEPGVGWNYCWSNDTADGISYASGDGLIYRRGNSHGGKVDSSNVASLSQFYHPDESFSNLLGCPLNGTWYIEVVDGWSIDNGYIFEWELSLNDELLTSARNGNIASDTLIGSYLSSVNDSDFVITPPEGITTDTVIDYTIRIITQNNTVIDSVIHVTFHPGYLTDRYDTICQNGVLSYEGNNYTTPGTYVDTLQTIYGCDSIVSLHLAVNPIYDTTLYDMFCDGQTYSSLGFVEDSAGLFTHNLSTTGGCDSTVHLQLTLNQGFDTTIAASVCSGITYSENGFEADTAGQYTRQLSTTNGCDSVVQLSLTVFPTYDSILVAKICQGNTYRINDFEVDSTGIFTHQFTTIHGCDSTVRLNLTVNPTFDTSLIASICDGDTYAGYGFTSGSGGTIIHSYTTTHGCDSTIRLDLTLMPVYDTTIHAAICRGETYIGNGFAESVAGNYSRELTTYQGCDSIVRLNLAISTIDTVIIADICRGDTYSENGFDESESGSYTHSLVTVNGCDSILTLRLNVWPTYSEEFNAHICEGDHYQMSGSTFDSTATYVIRFSTIHGCDSLQTLHLTVYPTYEGVIELTGCSNSYVEWNGFRYNQDGLYQQQLYTIHGCDSLLNLEVNMVDEAVAYPVATPTVCDLEHQEIYFKDDSRNTTSREWYINGELVSAQREFKYHYPDNMHDDTLLVTMMAHNEGGCDDTADLIVHYQHEAVYAPNVFTPDEPTNNKFLLGLDNIHDGHVWIYDRRGQFVYEFDALTGWWDGKKDGISLQQESYVWICRYHSNDTPDNLEEMVGTVTLLR